MSIKQKLIAGFSFLLLLTFALGLFAINRMGQVNDLSMTTANFWMPSIQLLAEANYYSAGFRRAEYEHILENSLEDMKKVEDKMASRSEKLLDALGKYEKILKTENEKRMLTEVKNAWMIYLKESEMMIKFSSKDQKTEALDYMRGPSNKAFDIVSKNLEEQIDYSNKGGLASGELGASTYHSSKILIYCVLFALLIIGAFLSAYLIKGIQATIQQTLKEVSKISIEVDNIAAKLSTASQELSANTNEQASAVQETASSTEEVTSMVNRTAENANAAKDITHQSLSKAEEGKVAIEKMAVAIRDIALSNEDISKQVDQSNHDLNEIVAMIHGIEEKTKVINDIVFQTKLLSFNASVEAARAGESGKGFAVVAEEVGNLADMSGKAAKDIAELLEDSIKRVSKVAEESQLKITSVVRSGKEKVDSGVKVAEVCERSLNQIVEKSNLSLERVIEINEAASQQSIGIHQIGKAIQELSASIQQNAHTTEHVSASAANLQGYTKSLNDLVNELANGKKA